ncbi:flagellar basal body L-ring protein FlgH [Desulfonatronospira sp.]|uniref:flagellar basal body L-ring protein FlgH n=1 Tax=Desulfonatronospira sp. TaxID=1962951 RepID=UPI0025C12DCD|nr:flagellar basal body L-ring protein FlgH [Desulfonatronospira sp.]
MNTYKVIIVFFAAIFLAACAPAHKKSTPMPSYGPEQYPDPGAITEADSPSLFQPHRTRFLFGDNRARNVGDIVTVHIQESSDAESRANTDYDRSSAMNFNSMPISAVAGGFFPGVGPAGTMGADPRVSSDSTSDFEGDGTTSRGSNVQASISARVVEVMDGGVMHIEGARQIKVNNETQIIAVRGLVRSRDVDSNNSISSTQLADAQIEMYGEGILADQQRPGWLSRALGKVWPF